MISRSALQRGSQLALRRQGNTLQRRGLAAAAAPSSSSGSFEATEHVGIKVASKDLHGPTTKLAIVAKAGTRYQPTPGLTVGLEEFAFKNTNKRSALRITRESELLGGQLNAYHTREALVVEASFLRSDLPYFAELLAEVITDTRYTTHEFHEAVEPVIKLKEDRFAHDASAIALDAAHSVAFHSGLGSAYYPTRSTPIGSYLNEHTTAAFAATAYTKSNIAVVADGASAGHLGKWIEAFYRSVPATSESKVELHTAASKYYGGEQRIANNGHNAVVLAFPGAELGSTKYENAVLVALLGGEPNIKWSPGFILLSKVTAASPGSHAHAKNHAYSDAGLTTIEIGGTATAVRKTALEAVKALRSVADGSVSKEDLTKAIAKAKFDLLAGSELSGVGLVSAGSSLLHGGKPLQVPETLKGLEAVTPEKLKTAAKTLLDGKATVVSVGDLFVLPFAEELGLKV